MTSTTRSRAPVIDAHGIEHRHGCGLPGWISDRPAMRGWHVVTCADCGCVRLVRAGVQ